MEGNLRKRKAWWGVFEADNLLLKVRVVVPIFKVRHEEVAFQIVVFLLISIAHDSQAVIAKASLLLLG